MLEEDQDTTFADNPVPGIGDRGRQALEDGPGASNATQVVGWYLRLNGDDEAMAEFLIDKCGCHGPSVQTAEAAVLESASFEYWYGCVYRKSAHVHTFVSA